MSDKRLDTTVSSIPSTNTEDLELVFGQLHNGIECALCFNATRKHDRAWFSAKQIENWSEMSTTTLWRWLGRLENAKRIQSFSDMKKIKIDDENGRGHETTLYNLNVLNQLAMACIANEKLNDVSCKFSDMLSEKETEFMEQQQQPMSDDEIMSRALEIAHRTLAAREERIKALASELQGTKAELEDTEKELDETQEALEDEIAQHAKDNADFCEGVKILNRQKAQISSDREAKALARNADVVQREKIATWMTYVQKKQMGTLRLGKYKVESLLGTTWMRSCLNLDKLKDVKRWMTYTATRRATIRVSNALDIAPKEVSKLRECYVQSKMYGIPFEGVCYENDILPNDYAYRIFADCVSVADTYECKKGNGETKLSPVCAYSVEILGEVLCAMIDAKALNEWLRDDTSKDDFAWWVVEKASSNYDLPVDAA